MTGAVRVLLYTDARELGGAELSLGNLAAGLSSRLDVAVMGVDPRTVGAIARCRPGTRAVVVPFIESRRDARAIGAQLRALARLRPDVLHVNLNGPWSSQLAILLGLLLPRVAVLAVEQLPTPAAGAGQRCVKRMLARRLSAHVAVSERSAREIEREVGLAPGSVLVIHNGVPDVGPRQPSPGSEGGTTIGAVGRLERQKGHDVLLRALAELPGTRLVLVGEGGERAGLERLAAELGVAERVRFEGWAEQPRLLLQGFDVLALPSRFEGFPLAVVEAMLAGLPVVASDVGGVREAVLPGETGLLVPPDDAGALAAALRELLADRPRRLALGARGRSLALERYTAAAMARSFESLYEEVRR
jgi:glycosyltransferase involved in cell wall biosynthesis